MQFGSDFDRLIEQFAPNTSNPIALAVSGGSDSMALLALAHDWSQRSGISLLILTVNHNLRAEAAAEARQVADRTVALGHRHQTLVWDTPRSSQSAARRARYRLLARAARKAGASCLLTGHTFDDVVETALIRRRRGVRSNAIAGPAPVAPLPVWPEGRGLTLMRPLVQSKRQDLRAHLQARAWDWADDPSNDKLEFERVRVRKFLNRHPKLAQLAASYVSDLQARRAQDLRTMAHTLNRVEVSADGLIRVTDIDLSDTLLRILARCASGGEQDARNHAISRLRNSLVQTGQRQTLGGAWFQRTTDGFLIGRDPSSQGGRQNRLFDGRYIQTPESPLPPRKDRAFLVRDTGPRDTQWQEIISERVQHIAACYQTPLVNPVQR